MSNIKVNSRIRNRSENRSADFDVLRYECPRCGSNWIYTKQRSWGSDDVTCGYCQNRIRIATEMNEKYDKHKN